MTDHRRRRPRRPGLFRWILRCRIELAAVAAGSAFADAAGPAPAGLLAASAGLLVASFPPARRWVVSGYQLVALPHRVRSALTESGAVDRRGHLPWVLWALSGGENAVRVEVKLRAGVTFDDLCDAVPHLQTACAAHAVVVGLHDRRSDRARIILIDPRWGMW